MSTSPLGLDPLLSLALALHNTRGAYACLLGSGLSRPAGIPTGWEIVEHLTRRLAAAEGPSAHAAAETDPAAWYRTRYRQEPAYSQLLEQMAATPTERREVLRPFFEPSEEERAQGLKVPTAAHRALARLMRDGVIRVALTTNFDQLLETALREAGVVPAVVASADHVSGMMPLHLAPATVIKLHGDYLDTRIKNTPAELATYDSAIDRLLDQVLDEYGLIVCGWSGTWDDALRRALTRAPSRRFTTFWAHRGPVTEEARALIEHRRAQQVEIASADAFFEAVAEKVTTLETLERPHPLSTAVAVASLKRYLPSPEQRIRAHDLLMDEVERLVERTAGIIKPDVVPRPVSLVFDAMARIEVAAETLMHLMATGCYWGDEPSRPLWITVLERLGTQSAYGQVMGGGYDDWRNLWRYGAQLAFYAGGLGALARGPAAEEVVADLLIVPKIRFDFGGKTESPAYGLDASAAVDEDLAKQLPTMERQYTPMSNHLCAVLTPVLRVLVADQGTYEDLFDRWEYLIALAFADGRRRAGIPIWAPVGRMAWRRVRGHGEPTVREQVAAEIDRDGANWLLLRRGLFDGSRSHLRVIQDEINAVASRRIRG